MRVWEVNQLENYKEHVPEARHHLVKILLDGDYISWQNDVMIPLTRTKREYIVINQLGKKYSSDALDKYNRWMDDSIKACDILVVWFQSFSVQRNSWKNIGKALMRKKKLIVGIYPNYAMREAAERSLKINQPDIQICYNVSDLTCQLIDECERIYNGLYKCGNCKWFKKPNFCLYEETRAMTSASSKSCIHFRNGIATFKGE